MHPPPLVSAGTLAGRERELAQLAHEEAVRLYRMALATHQTSGVADEQTRAALTLALGDALARAGDVEAARASYHQTTESARRLSPVDPAASASLLARAALGVSMVADTGKQDPALLGLLEEASAVLSTEESALRARVLARLAVALIPTDGTEDRRRALSEEAVAIARRLGDGSALAVALHAWLLAAWRPENAEERLEAATQVTRLAREAGDGGLAFRGHGRRVATLLELGDTTAAGLEIEVCVRLADALREPYYLWSAAVMRAMRALLTGRLDQGEGLVQEALTIGARAQASDAFGAFATQTFALRRDQGRLAELAPLVAGLVARLPAVAAVRSALALLYTELGQYGAARAELERLAVDDFAGIPRDEGWLVTLANLAEVCAALGDTTRAAILVELLRPHADRCVAVGMGIGFAGAVSHYLGLLTATLGRWEQAGAYFAGALAFHRRIGARAWFARSAAAYATMLVTKVRAQRLSGRNGADAALRRQAHGLLLEARAIARELEMARVLEESNRLLAESGAVNRTPTIRDPVGARLTAPDGAVPAAAPPTAGDSMPPVALTDREVEVLRLLASGASNQEMADTLVVSIRTVERHLLHIYGKIGVRRRASAVAYAHRAGLA